MFLIDTHSHIYLNQFDDDRAAMMQRASDAGVQKIFLPNINMESVQRVHDLSDQYPNRCFPMMGLHPCDVKEDYAEVLRQMRELFSQRKYIAVGEMGIDLYWDKTTLPMQVEAFKIQCAWAKELSLPIVIHARDSFNEIFEVLDEINDASLFGVFHCFTGTLEQAQKVLSYGGFKMGIGGVITYPKSGLADVVKDIPLEHLVLETDAPFLTPVPYRGKRNESAYVKFVAEKLAEAKGISLKEISEVTTNNALQLFGLTK